MMVEGSQSRGMLGGGEWEKEKKDEIEEKVSNQF